MLELVLGAIAAVAIGAAIWLAKRHSAARDASRVLQAELASVQARFAPILDVEGEAARVREALATERRALEAETVAARARADEETRRLRQAVEDERAAMEARAVEARSTAKAEIEQLRQALEEDRRAAESEAVAIRARMEADAARARSEWAANERAAASKEQEARERQAELAGAYQKARETFDRLQREVSLLEENIEDISFGVYKPHFDYASSQEYKDRLERVWTDQKALIKAERHVHFGVAWTIGDSRKEGERMQKQYGKLLLRAFNGECDACIAKVSWNNITRMEERIVKGFEAINELGGVMKISVTPEYRELRLQELRLHYELEEKRRAEAEEQRRLKEQMREEERAQRELERARQEAEDEERRFAKALEKARKEMEQAQASKVIEAAELDALNERVQKLQAELDEAHQQKERAISQAQLTRSGHVYIISNVGSFGDDVVKIGMTRRLEPKERIKELGDASVPFEFDVHGLVYSEDAPSLEHELHQRFHDRRVNLVNERKEFFRVALKEIDDFLRTKTMKVDITLLAEAREFRETLAIRQKAADDAGRSAVSPPSLEAASFPDRLF
jgi:hypothetical protein